VLLFVALVGAVILATRQSVEQIGGFQEEEGNDPLLRLS
jgi:hypothetical protein